MKNGRCRMHGGRSTGARSKEGLRRIRRAKLVHGHRSVIWRRIDDLQQSCTEELQSVAGGVLPWDYRRDAVEAAVAEANEAIDQALREFEEDMSAAQNRSGK